MSRRLIQLLIQEGYLTGHISYINYHHSQMARKKQVAQKKVKKSSKAKPVEQEQQPPKSKPIIKARKYKKNTYEEASRIRRSKHDRMYLITANRNEMFNIWSFTVQGASGSNYSVSVSTTVACTCMDYRIRKLVCKHIYFIVTQVGQNEELVEYFRRDRSISKNAFKILDQQLSSRLKARLEASKKESKDIDLTNCTDCVICFTEMDKEQETLEDCGTCKKFFHSECIMAWKVRNPTCPLCRGNLVKLASGTGALAKVQNISV